MIELLPNCEAPEWTSQKKLCVPAIHMQTDNGAVMLTGEVGPVAEDGLVVLEKLSLRSYYAFYPDLLVLSLLGKQTGLYSVKDVKKKNYVLEDAEQRLASFIAYAQAAINFPSLLMPDWIKTIFEEEDPKKVVKKVFNDNAFLDPYVRYFADKYDDAALNKVLDKARKNVIHLFGRELQGNEEDSL